ncbi:hypothetical protein FQN60_012925, partial [Etheostoma spectabile]
MRVLGAFTGPLRRVTRSTLLQVCNWKKNIVYKMRPLLGAASEEGWQAPEWKVISKVHVIAAEAKPFVLK